jgi:predicted nucleic acid-binding protein
VPRSVIIDTSGLVALLDPRDEHHKWSRTAVADLSLPWLTCEAVASEAFFLLTGPEADRLTRILRDERLRITSPLGEDVESVLDLMEKYASVPMSIADACLVRMSEILPEPVVVTTDNDFKIYRRHSRQVIPCLMP